MFEIFGITPWSYQLIAKKDQMENVSPISGSLSCLPLFLKAFNAAAWSILIGGKEVVHANDIFALDEFRGEHRVIIIHREISTDG